MYKYELRCQPLDAKELEHSCCIGKHIVRGTCHEQQHRYAYAVSVCPPTLPILRKSHTHLE